MSFKIYIFIYNLDIRHSFALITRIQIGPDSDRLICFN